MKLYDRISFRKEESQAVATFLWPSAQDWERDLTSACSYVCRTFIQWTSKCRTIRPLLYSNVSPLKQRKDFPLIWGFTLKVVRITEFWFFIVATKHYCTWNTHRNSMIKKKYGSSSKRKTYLNSAEVFGVSNFCLEPFWIRRILMMYGDKSSLILRD